MDDALIQAVIAALGAVVGAPLGYLFKRRTITAEARKIEAETESATDASTDDRYRSLLTQQAETFRIVTDTQRKQIEDLLKRTQNNETELTGVREQLREMMADRNRIAAERDMWRDQYQTLVGTNEGLREEFNILSIEVRELRDRLNSNGGDDS